jgi:hypothetical protein
VSRPVHDVTAGGRALCSIVFGLEVFWKIERSFWGAIRKDALKWAPLRDAVTCDACRVAGDWCLERGVKMRRDWRNEKRFDGRSIAARKAMSGER